MENISKIIEMRGINRNEIVDYLISIGGTNVGCGNIEGKGWNILVGEEKSISIGILSIKSVTIEFSASKGIFEEIYSAFSLKFMRAGG